MYKEVLHNISIFEKKKFRNQERIKTLEKENNRLSDELKKLYNLKNQFEKLNTEASNLIIIKKDASAKEKLKNFIQSILPITSFSSMIKM